MTDPVHYHATNQVPYKCASSGYEEPKPITCRCGHKLFDGQIFRVRVLKVCRDGQVRAKCQCKSWQLIPLRYDDSGLSVTI